MSEIDTQSDLILRGADELAEAVCRAMETTRPLVDYGIAHAGFGHAPPADRTVFQLQATNETGPIIEHYERDMTVLAAAGGTLSAMNHRLESSNQFVPIDADDDLTIGEIIHHNVYGPLRVGYGGVRDLTLGLNYIDHQGRQIHVGGRTVKNVAGYDVSRFMVGSLGEFGIVYEATLRTYAIPTQVTQVDLRIADPSVLDRHATDLLLSDAAPVHFSYSHSFGRPLPHHESSWIAHLAYYGEHTGCMVQVRSLETLVDTLDGVHIDGCGDHSFAQDQTERTARRAWRRTVPALVKIIVPPASTGSVCVALDEFAQAETPLHIDAMPIHGCIFAGGHLDADAAARLDAMINTTINGHGGMRAWYAIPTVTGNDSECNAPPIEPFAPSQPEWAILRKLKQTMDPQNLFNPGRFLTPEA